MVVGGVGGGSDFRGNNNDENDLNTDNDSTDHVDDDDSSDDLTHPLSSDPTRTASFVASPGKALTTTITEIAYDHLSNHLSNPDATRWKTIKSLSFAVALAFASGSIATSPASFPGPQCYCHDCDLDGGLYALFSGDGCPGATDWLLVGSLAYQCYFFWTAARDGMRDLVGVVPGLHH